MGEREAVAWLEEWMHSIEDIDWDPDYAWALRARAREYRTRNQRAYWEDNGSVSEIQPLYDFKDDLSPRCEVMGDEHDGACMSASTSRMRYDLPPLTHKELMTNPHWRWFR